MFLCVPMLVLDGTLCNVSGSLWNVFGQLLILSDPTKNLGTLKIKCVRPINAKKPNSFSKLIPAACNFKNNAQ